MRITNELEMKNYNNFMYNENNIKKCYKCPENRHFNEGPNYNILPCGQFNCLVKLHCK